MTEPIDTTKTAPVTSEIDIHKGTATGVSDTQVVQPHKFMNTFAMNAFASVLIDCALCSVQKEPKTPLFKQPKIPKLSISRGSHEMTYCENMQRTTSVPSSDQKPPPSFSCSSYLPNAKHRFSLEIFQVPRPARRRFFALSQNEYLERVSPLSNAAKRIFTTNGSVQT